MEFLDNKSYFDGDKPLIIPHRGGSNIVPENTLHGLELAIKEGFSHFETPSLTTSKFFFFDPDASILNPIDSLSSGVSRMFI